MAEALEREPAMLIVASSRIRRANPQSSIKLAKTSSPPPCFSAIFQSHLPPRPVGPAMRFEVSSRLGLTTGQSSASRHRGAASE
jgi:hypothetical protein